MCREVKLHVGAGEHEGVEGAEGNEGLEAKEASEEAGEVCEACEVCWGSLRCRRSNEWEHIVPR
jgi:hypothetical protein